MSRLEQTIMRNLLYNEEYARKVLPFIQSDYFHDNTILIKYISFLYIIRKV